MEQSETKSGKAKADAPIAVSGWNDQPRRNALKAQARQIKPGEFDGILAQYNFLAKKLKIDNPPPLKVAVAPSFGGPGAHGNASGVTIDEPLLKVLNSRELKFLLDHELGHVKDQRAKKEFDDWQESERSADKIALDVTHDREAGISGLSKIVGLPN